MITATLDKSAAKNAAKKSPRISIASREEAEAIAKALRPTNNKPVNSKEKAAAQIRELYPNAHPAGESDDYVADIAASITPRLHSLRKEHEQFEARAFKTYRARLHSLLTKTYQLALDIINEPERAVRDDMRRQLRAFLNEHKVAVKRDGPLMDQCVLAVFGHGSRSRKHAYVKTCRAALTAGPGGSPLYPGDLAPWIDACGGVEEIRTGNKNKGLNPRQRSALVSADLAKVIGSIKVDASHFEFTGEDFDSEYVLIASYSPSRELQVRAIVKNSAALTAAKLAYFAKHRHRLSPKTLNTSLPLSPVQSSEPIADAGGEPV